MGIFPKFRGEHKYMIQYIYICIYIYMKPPSGTIVFFPDGFVVRHPGDCQS